MQVDEVTLARYEAAAPELLNDVVSGESAHVMKRDANTDYCVKFDQGWCGIHATRGSDFLGDACHFFPRITRQIGAITLQTASISCPEITRLALRSSQSPSQWHEAETNRLPSNLHNYKPDELSDESALAVHEAFLKAALTEDADAGRIIARMHSVAQSMQAIDKATWPMAVEFYLKTADSRITQPQPFEHDKVHLYHALVGLVGAAKKSNRPRLEAVIDTMQRALDVTFDEQTRALQFGEAHTQNSQQMQQAWSFMQASWQPFFKRWIVAELGAALFPYSGFGDSLAERITIIGIRLATLQLAMQCHSFVHQTLDEDDAIRLAQTLSRFLDHLSNPALSMQIYTETGWIKTERLWSLF